MASQEHLSPEELELYVMDDLDPARVESFIAHAGACERCGRALQRAAQAEQALYELAAEVAPLPDPEPRWRRWWSLALSRRWWNTAYRWLTGPALACAAAAGIVLFMQSPDLQPLTGYQLEVTGGEQETRSAVVEVVGPRTFKEGSQLKLVLRPEQSSEVEPQVLVYVDEFRAAARLEGLKLQVSDSGSVLLRGSFGQELALPAAGSHQLLVALAPADAPLELDSLERALHGASEASIWQVWVVPIDVRTD